MQTASNAKNTSDYTTGSLSYIDTLVTSAVNSGKHFVMVETPYMNDEMSTDLIDNYGYNVTKYYDNNNDDYVRYLIDWTGPDYIPNIIYTYDFGSLLSYSGSGNSVIDTIGHSNGTLYNSPSFSSTNGGGSIAFVGSSSQYLINNNDLTSYFGGTYPNKSTAISAAMWIYPTGNGLILSETSQNGWHNGIIEMVGGTLKFGLWNGGFVSMTSTIATPLNNWYHVVLTYDGTTMVAYINGLVACSGTLTRQEPYNLSPAKPIYYAIGLGDSTNMGDGTYGDFRLGMFELLDGALSSKEVSNRFKFYQSRFGL
jgi:hypothetical protein